MGRFLLSVPSYDPGTRTDNEPTPPIAALLVVAALLACGAPESLCPETWGGPDAADSGGRCAPPEDVVEAAEARLTTGIYGYIIKGEYSGCGTCETALGRHAVFGLTWTSADGGSEVYVEIESGDAATFEAELTPGLYEATDSLITPDERVASDDEGFPYFLLEEGDVLFFAVDLGCAVSC